MNDNNETPKPDTQNCTKPIEQIPNKYPYAIFKRSLQNFRNPVKGCCKACVICPILETRCFTESTILKHRYPINLPNPKQFFNCQTKNVIYLIICKTPGCGSQYVGYTTREFVFRAAEHLSNHTSPMVRHCKETQHSLKQVKFQIVALVPGLETNKELWLKRHEYHWICRLGTLNKLSNKGLNKMPYDPVFHSNPKPWGTPVHSASDPRPPLLINNKYCIFVALHSVTLSILLEEEMKTPPELQLWDSN